MKSEIKWTQEQQNAITASGGSITISAAAGSGKTAVLVERVIRQLLDEENPIPPERFLIVTFTRAAAAEMKRKIKAALKSRIGQSKRAENAYYNLDRAIISTMDSYCINLLRENFDAAGISPDFRLLDAAELDSMSHDALALVLENRYASNPDFGKVAEYFIRGRDDSYLAECIRNLSKNAQSQPKPYAWLDQIERAYDESVPPQQSPWGAYLLSYVQEAVTFCRQLMNNAISMMQTDEAVDAAYGKSIREVAGRLCDFLQLFSAGAQWDTLAAALESLKNRPRIGTFRGSKENETAIAVKAIWNKEKTILDNAQKCLCISSRNVAADICELKPIVREITEAAKNYSECLMQLKKEKNAYDFSDVLHFCIDLLYDENNRETPLCRKISDAFDAVMIDEYQDTTRAQDSLFRAISDQGRKMFVVGDVKQSIYGFRLATPDIFVERCEEAHPIAENRFPAKIVLGKNFRSRAGILDFVNDSFSLLMSPRAGSVQYDETEYLYYGGNDFQDSQDVELLLADHCAGVQEEAEAVADYIQQKILSAERIRVKGEERPVSFRDFCILLRGTKKNAQIFADALSKRNIPAVFERKVNYFSLTEVRVLCAILSITDNPLNNVELLSVLCFPLFGFSPDDLAKIRHHSGGYLYNSVTLYGEKHKDNTAEKCRRFLAELQLWRECAAAMKTSDFVRHIVWETDFSSMIASMPEGETRLFNLNSIISYAQSYENSGAVGYSGFIRYLDRIRESESSVERTENSEKADRAVTVMSIHKSKGLEFPYVIVANLAERFNTRDLNDSFLVDADYGIGMKIQDRKTLRSYSSLPYDGVRAVRRNKSISEEIRLLYVAMTRASCKLILSAGVKDAEKYWEGQASLLPAGEKADPFGVLQSSSYLDLLSLVLLRHPDCGVLRNLAKTDGRVLPMKSHIQVQIQTVQDGGADSAEQQESGGKPFSRKPFDADTFAAVVHQIEKPYAYESLAGIPAKITASGFAAGRKNYSKVSLNQPSFAVSRGVSGFARGNAYHAFLQHCDFASTLSDITRESRRLVEEHYLSRQELDLVNPELILRFLSSETGKDLLRADKIYREFSFRIMLPVSELYAMESDESVLVQGIADLVILKDGQATVIDYKTDCRADDDYLIEHYRPQLLIYRKAIEELLGVHVTQTAIYSLSASRKITI